MGRKPLYKREKFTITLPSKRNANEPSWRRYGILCIPRSLRQKFPGYKEEFSIASDAGRLEARVSSARKGTPTGDPKAGEYITGMGPFYSWHSDIKPGTPLAFTRIGRFVYHLEIEAASS